MGSDHASICGVSHTYQSIQSVSVVCLPKIHDQIAFLARERGAPRAEAATPVCVFHAFLAEESNSDARPGRIPGLF